MLRKQRFQPHYLLGPILFPIVWMSHVILLIQQLTHLLLR